VILLGGVSEGSWLGSAADMSCSWPGSTSCNESSSLCCSAVWRVESISRLWWQDTTIQTGT